MTRVRKMPDFYVTLQVRVAAPDMDRAMDWVEETLLSDDNVRSVDNMMVTPALEIE